MGKEVKILEGSIWNMLPRYALPIAATGILEQLFNASDIAVVGNFTGDKGTTAVAAVGANSPVIGLIINLFIGIALGANVVIAKAVGQKNEQTVHKAVHTSIIMALIGGLIVGIFGQIFAGSLLAWLKVPEDTLPYALLYLRIYLISLPVILLYNFEAAFFRSIGETKIPLQALAMSGVLNVILNLIFVIVFKRTVDGVAMATVISNAVSALLLLVRLLKTDQVIRVEISKIRFHRSVFTEIMRIGLPAGVQSAVFALANIVIQSAINSLGTVVMAASSAGFNIEILAYYILNSFSQACTTFVGQNYGAKQLDRCKKTLYLCLLEDTIASAAAVTLVLLFGRFLVSVFNRDPQVVEYGYMRLRFILPAYTFSMLYEIVSGYLRGFGISFVPALLTTLGVCGIRFFWVFSVFPQSRTFETIMIVYPISLAATAFLILIAALCYRPAKKYANMGKKGADRSRA